MNALQYSIATAAVAGLLTGAVMKPGPDALADRPNGPQILVSGAQKRVIDANGWYADVRFTGYNGEIPEHVLGTDWTEAPAYDLASFDAGYGDYAPLTEEAEAVVEPAVYEAPVRTAEAPGPKHIVVYPSVDGDILGGLRDEPSAPQVVQIESDEASLPS